MPLKAVHFWARHKVGSCALTHSIGFIQSNVEAEKELEGFATNRSSSRKELHATGEAKLSTELLQDQAVRKSEEK